MLEFFIALFGGSYYLGKFIGDKGSIYQQERKNKEIEQRRYELLHNHCISLEEARTIKRRFLNCEYFEYICQEFQDEFEYVFGDGWRDIINMPCDRLRLSYKYGDWDIDNPDTHSYWVYRLLLASQCKIDESLIWKGYHLASIYNRDMSVKFAETIERRLEQAGIEDIRLVFVNGGLGHMLQIESLCINQHQRLW